MEGKEHTSRPKNPGSKPLRFTFLMSVALERNLAVYAFKSGITKQDAITLAVEGLLRSADLDPTMIPTVSVTYGESQ